MLELIWSVTQTYWKLYARLFIDKDWQCLEVSEKASHFLEWCPIWVTSQRVSLLRLIEGGIYGPWKSDSRNIRSPCITKTLPYRVVFSCYSKMLGEEWGPDDITYPRDNEQRLIFAAPRNFPREKLPSTFSFPCLLSSLGDFLKVFSWGYRYAQLNGKLEGVA